MQKLTSTQDDGLTGRVWPGPRMCFWLTPLVTVFLCGSVLAEEFVEVTQPVRSISESAAESLARPPHVRTRNLTLRPGSPERPPELTEIEIPEALLREDQQAGAVTGPLVGETFSSFPGPSGISPLPPDPDIAVGPGHVVVVTNLEITVYTKSGNRVFGQDWEGFFGGVQDVEQLDSLFDPKVLYDVTLSRFFVVLIGVREGTAGTFTGSSYLIAVSDTSDATGNWRKFNSDSAVGGSWSDYPSIGVDATSLYISSNYFSFAGTQFTACNVRVYPKNQMISGFFPPTTLTFFDNTNLRDGEENQGELAFTIQPSVSYVETNIQWMVSAKPPVRTGERRIILWRVDGGTAPRSIRRFTITLPANLAYNVFSAVAVQPSGRDVLDALEGRMINAVRIGNSVWAAHTNPGINGRNAARWYEFDVNNQNNPVLKQAGEITAPQNHPLGSCFNPAVCANDIGDAVITYTRSSSVEMPSMYYSARASDDPAGAMPTTIRVTPGTESYIFFRWGDYAGAALDPVDRATLWVINQSSANFFTWRTTVARIPLTPGGGTGPGVCPSPLALVAPNGDENWVKGTTQLIQWTGGAGNADAALVNVMLAKHNPFTQQSEVIGLIRNSSGGVDFSANAGGVNWVVGQNVADVNDLGTNIFVPASGDFADYQIKVQAVFCPDDVIISSVNFFRILDALVVDASADPVLIVRGESTLLSADVFGGRPPYQFRWTPQELVTNANIFRTEARPHGGTRQNCDPDLECVTYTVEVRDSSGPTPLIVTDTVVVKIQDPLRVDAGPTKRFPAGGTVVLEGFATGGGRPYNYLWTPTPDPTSPGSANVAQPVARPPGNTIYTLTVTDRFGNSESDTVGTLQGFTVNTINQPVEGGSITRDFVQAFYLPGEVINFTATPNPGFTFQRWEITPAGGQTNMPSDNPVAVVMPNGNLSVVAVYSPGGGQAARPLPFFNGGGTNNGAPLGGCGMGVSMTLGGVSMLLLAASVSRRRRG
jgi:hypothetical protein